MRIIIPLAIAAVFSLSGVALAQEYGPSALQPSSVGTASPGQVPGTTTNDNATAGNVGEIIIGNTSATTSTVTITIAAPGVVSWTAHGLGLGSAVQFTTTGALPTGLAISTTYWVIPVDANSFRLATSIANAIAGTAITTSGSQSGVQTALSAAYMASGVGQDVGFVNLTAGDWDVNCTVYFAPDGTTISTILRGWVNTVSATAPTGVGTGAYLLVQESLTGAIQLYPVGTTRVSVAGTTPVYCGSRNSFSVSFLNVASYIRARRVR